MPGNSKHATVSKNGCKILVIGHSHVKRIRRIDFNKDIRNEKSYICSFNGAVIKQLDHCIIPSLVYEKPEAFIIHGGTNNILYNASYKVGIPSRLIQIVDAMIFISSVLIKKS